MEQDVGNSYDNYYDDNEDPYGRVGDFNGRRFNPSKSRADNNFYWQQKQQQAANLHSKNQQKSSQLQNHQQTTPTNSSSNSNNQSSQQMQQQQQFDPYAIYTEEEDVWYSEERLLEDHLAEIFNRWDTLDDDIWCKLIIMERNRRIGKAYARVPLITIDGSYQLSYDGEKLALNGFDNPDRDSRTEDCRRRIGKGIRIKMDNFGNVLITRRTKASIFVKEWLPPNGSQCSPPNSLGDNSSAGSSSGLADNYQRLKASQEDSATTPSRSRVIKNLHRQQLIGAAATRQQPMNESAICEEVISVGGRLEWEKIYVMFDMKKFQANITQELCQQFPDKRKLEQQCVSIVGLVADSEEILSLPCWLMVINIVAIEILNERFPRDFSSPYMSTHIHPADQDNPRSAPMGAAKQPSFLSIFDQQQQQQQQQAKRNQAIGQATDEDPYSMPANASSSDLKSSINDGYGTTSTKYQHISTKSHYTSQSAANKASKGQQVALSAPELIQSKSSLATSRYAHQQQQQHNHRHSNHPNHSIYSPGHMLVLPQRSGDAKPPKLPPRDFTKMAPAHKQPKEDSIYSTGLMGSQATSGGKEEKPARLKSKKSRFLESLKAPLMNSTKSSMERAELAQGKEATKQVANQTASESTKKAAKTSTKSSLKSFLGVKSSSASTSSSSACSPGQATKAATKDLAQSDQVTLGKNLDQQAEIYSSVLDSTGDKSATSRSTSSFNDDLDIPTPDYETDENIYAIGLESDKENCSANRKHKDDLKSHYLQSNEDKAIVERRNSRETSRFMLHNNNNKLLGGGGGGSRQAIGLAQQHSIYGSTLGLASHHQLSSSRSVLPNGVNSHFRSASMQRSCSQQRFPAYAPSSSHSTSAAYQSGAFKGPAHYQQLTGHYGPGKYASPLQPAYANRFRHQLVLDDRDIYGRAGYVSTSSQESPYAMGALPTTKSQNYASSYLSGQPSRLSSQQQQQQLASQKTRRRSLSRLGKMQQQPTLNHMEQQQQQQLGPRCPSNCCVASGGSHYDIGRSSSGIYGNNSSSSSSDYVDWHPQMRKVNSSGYLNSIFKNHHLILPTNNNQSQHQQSSSTTTPTTVGANNGKQYQAQANNATVATAAKSKDKPKENNGADLQPQSNWKMAKTTASNNNNDNHQHQDPKTSDHNQMKASKQAIGANSHSRSNYRLYESSSNDSYTNSSDGFDIYDRIELSSTSQQNDAKLRVSSIAGQARRMPVETYQAGNRKAKLASGDFDNQYGADSPGRLLEGRANEIHVGQWENYCDR